MEKAIDYDGIAEEIVRDIISEYMPKQRKTVTSIRSKTK